jgi:class 3 adenylate cyclase
MDKRTYRIEVEQAIDQILLEESRQIELKLAYVRAVILVMSGFLDFVCYLYPRETMGVESMPMTVPAFSLGWATVSVALAAALRAGWYRPWMRLVLPIMDSVLVSVVFVNLWTVMAHAEPKYAGILINMSAICSLLAVSGGIRLARSAAITTTLLALANFILVATLFNLSPALSALAGTSILAAGFLGVWMTGIVRRQVQSETGRSIIERLLPKKVVDEAFRDPLGLVSKPRSCHVTIVVTDLREFTAFSEKLPPEDVFEFLNTLQGTLAKIIRDHGGTVDKFLGDGMLAVFGAPDPVEDHASRALKAAAAMRAAVASLNREREERGQPTVRLGIGLHTGPVVAGCLGSGAKIEFTVIGDTVNVASRIENLTKEKGVDVLVSGDTVRGAADLPELRPMGEVVVRGRRQPLEIHALAR